MILVYGWNHKSGSSSASRNGTQPWHGHNHSFVFTLAFILGGPERGMIGLNDNRRSAIVSSRFFLCIDLWLYYFTSILDGTSFCLGSSSILPCPGLFATPAILVWSPLAMLADMVLSYDGWCCEGCSAVQSLMISAKPIPKRNSFFESWNGRMIYKSMKWNGSEVWCTYQIRF